jgi:hypothetical protein
MMGERPATATFGRLSPLVVGVLGGSAFAVLSLLSAWRGRTSTVTMPAAYLWLVTYDHGFIKRGLVGTLATALAGGSAVDFMTVLRWHTIVTFVVVVSLAAWLGLVVAQSGSRAAAWLVFFVGALAAAAHTFPTLLLAVGYLDPFTILFVIACALLMARGHLLAASIVGVIGTVAHETFVVLWAVLAVLAFALVSGTGSSLRRGWVLVLPFLSGAAVMLANNPDAGAAEIRSLGFPPDVTQNLTSAPFHETLVSAWFTMLPGHALYWRFELVAVIIFAGPAALAAALYLWSRWGQLTRAEAVAVLVAAVVPCLVVILASDTSRFLVRSPVMVLITVLVLESRRRPPPRMNRAVGIMVVVACIAWLAMPRMYWYTGIPFGGTEVLSLLGILHG